MEIKTFSFKKMRLKVSSAKWCPLCLSLNDLMEYVNGLVQERFNSIANTLDLRLSGTNFSLTS